MLAVLAVPSCGGSDAAVVQPQAELRDHGASPAPDDTTEAAIEENPAAPEPDARTAEGTSDAGTPEHREGAAGSPARAGERRGESFTYHDGDAERTVWLVLQEPLSRAAGTGTASDASGEQLMSPGTPVFVSESGSRMTLPGGVVLLLDTAWSAGDVESFFAANEISLDRVSELGWIGNGFLVETEAGLASLELANVLATQQGVESSSPNWARELVPQ